MGFTLISNEPWSHSQILLWQVPIAFFFRLHESLNPRPHGPILKWGALSLPTELVSGSESAAHFNIGPCGRGFELSWRRKKKAIGTCHNSICEWDHGSLEMRVDPTIKGAFYYGGPTPRPTRRWAPPTH